MGTKRDDIVDFDNNSMIIFEENVEKYIKIFHCKDKDDLVYSLWFDKGMSAQIVR